ncbi:hypothetical protein ACKKBF_B10145 [Auxenochlorella protothecoides x Auxenochlorella symbiontica]
MCRATDHDQDETFPVRRLLFWGAKDRAAELKAFDCLLYTLLRLQGSQTGPWRTQCVSHRAAPPVDPSTRGLASRIAMDEERHMGVRGKEVHAVTGSPFSDRSALVLRESDQVMMGDARMADLVTKAGAYKAHVGLHLEGSHVQVGDFNVGISRAVLRPGEIFTGVVLDVGYAPLTSWTHGRAILEDFQGMLSEAVEASGGRLQAVPEKESDSSLQGTGRHALQLVRLMRLLAA